MFTLTELSREFYDLTASAKRLLLEILADLAVEPDVVTFNPNEAIETGNDDSGPLYLIKDGYVKLELGTKLLLFFETGDLVGLGTLFRHPEANLYSEFTVRLERYNRQAFYAALAARPDLLEKWHRYTEKLLGANGLIIANLTTEDLKIAPETLRFEPGDPIIIQNTEPHQVFTMLSGTASVYVGDKRVGQVLTGEIFGAMAATSNTRRTASVIAQTPCLVLSFPKEHFLALAESHPETVLKLIEDMSRVIVSQNAKLVELDEHIN